MPADRGVNNGHWNERPHFMRANRPGHTAEAVDYNNENEVARCLMEDDPAYQAYELFQNVDLSAEALLSAREIIRKREATYVQHVRSLNDAKILENTARRAEMRKQTRYIGRVIDIKSGMETIVESSTAVPARSFA